MSDTTNQTGATFDWWIFEILTKVIKIQHEHVNSFSQVIMTFQLHLLMILNLFYQPNLTSSLVYKCDSNFMFGHVSVSYWYMQVSIAIIPGWACNISVPLQQNTNKSSMHLIQSDKPKGCSSKGINTQTEVIGKSCSGFLRADFLHWGIYIHTHTHILSFLI